MPLTNDVATEKVAHDTIEVLRKQAGHHLGHRPAHAKGLALAGTFTPTPAASSLSSAPHFSSHSTPVTARISNFTGFPHIADNDPNASPRGFGLRFHLPEENGRRHHTDIVAHSANGFPSRTGEDFLSFLSALLNSPDAPDGIGAYLASHPAAMAFVRLPKPTFPSFANFSFYAISAFVFVNARGEEKAGRYMFTPVERGDALTEEDLKGKSPNFLFDEIKQRLSGGNAHVAYKLAVQLAEPDDPTDDATKTWQGERKTVELGEIKLTEVVEHNGEEQQRLIFDPVPRGIDGIHVSKDPLFNIRADTYLISGKERRTESLEQ